MIFSSFSVDLLYVCFKESFAAVSYIVCVAPPLCWRTHTFAATFCLLLPQRPCQQRKRGAESTAAPSRARARVRVSVCARWKNTPSRYTTSWPPLFLQLLTKPISTLGKEGGRCFLTSSHPSWLRFELFNKNQSGELGERRAGRGGKKKRALPL